MELCALKRFRSVNVRKMRVCQHTAGVNHKASAIPLACRRFNIPQTFAFVVSQPGDGLVCSCVFSNPEFFDDVVRIFEQLALRGVFFLEWIRNKGNGIQPGWDIHLGSGIRVVAPGATDICASFQQHKIIKILPLQTDRREQTRKTGADNHGFKMLRILFRVTALFCFFC